MTGNLEIDIMANRLEMKIIILPNFGTIFVEENESYISVTSHETWLWFTDAITAQND